MPLGGIYGTSLDTVVWTNKDPATGIADDDSKVLDIAQARTIAIQVDTTHAGNTSDDVDVNVIVSVDGDNWDTEIYQAISLTDGKIQTVMVTPGFKRMKLELDDNDAATVAYVTARVFARF